MTTGHFKTTILLSIDDSGTIHALRNFIEDKDFHMMELYDEEDWHEHYIDTKPGIYEATWSITFTEDYFGEADYDTTIVLGHCLYDLDKYEREEQ